MKKRRDTKLEAEGAEFLVVGWLLVNGIEAHKTYSKMPGYDLIAVNAKGNKSCRIQVKSRYQTGVGHFIIKEQRHPLIKKAINMNLPQSALLFQMIPVKKH